MELPSPINDSQEEEMTIYLKIMKTTTMKVQRSDTIGTIKSAICEEKGITRSFQELFFNGDRLKDGQILPHQYNLICAGEVLEDHRTLASLNLQTDPTLLLVFNPKDVLSFSVITPAGETLKLKVKLLYSVSKVKAIIGGVIGVPDSDYDLIHHGRKLEDSNSLACYNLQEESVLEMSPHTFQVFVKAWSGKTITLNVHHRDTVQDVKDKIFQKLGGPGYCQSIVFSGKRLEASNDLAYYNIRKHATLYMVFSPTTVTSTMVLSDSGAGPNSSATIRDLKAMIRNKIPKMVKEVYFRGKPLQDECSIASYNIGQSDLLTVVSEQRW